MSDESEDARLRDHSYKIRGTDCPSQLFESEPNVFQTVCRFGKKMKCMHLAVSKMAI